MISAHDMDKATNLAEWADRLAQDCAALSVAARWMVRTSLDGKATESDISEEAFNRARDRVNEAMKMIEDTAEVKIAALRP